MHQATILIAGVCSTSQLVPFLPKPATEFSFSKIATTDRVRQGFVRKGTTSVVPDRDALIFFPGLHPLRSRGIVPF